MRPGKPASINWPWLLDLQIAYIFIAEVDHDGFALCS